MIPDQMVEISLSPRYKAHFLKCGYPEASLRRGEKLKVKISELPLGSNALVLYRCDGCGATNKVAYFTISKKEKHLCRACTQKGHAPSNKVAFTAEQRIHIRKLYEEEKLPAEKIAADLDSNQALILRVLHEEGVSVHRRAKEPNVTCPVCGKRFRLGPSELREANCCSKKCLGIHNRKDVSRTCEKCGKSFVVKPHQTSRRFCTLDCWYLANQKGCWTTCMVCGKGIYTTPARPKQFCSKQCSGIAHERKLPIYCAHCGKKKLIPKAHDRSDIPFCSYACARAYRVANQAYFAEIREKIGLSHKARWENDKKWAEKRRRELAEQALDTAAHFTFHKSALEKKVHQMLEDLGLSYTKWKRIQSQRFNVTKEFDLYFPETNTYVEIHGTFWHADPRVYDREKLTSSIQIRNLKNDRIKATIIQEEVGAILEFLWESDIHADPAMTISKLRKWAGGVDA